jgi:hypothetical protein
MKTDPGLAAVRAAREAISRELGNDPARLVAFYIERQRTFTGPLLQGPAAAQPAEASASVADRSQTITR